MKKFLFSAIALIGFTVASYGANAVEKEEDISLAKQDVSHILNAVVGTCTITVTWTDSDGNKHTRVHYREVNSEEECGYAADSIRLAYQVGAAQLGLLK